MILYLTDVSLIWPQHWAGKIPILPPSKELWYQACYLGKHRLDWIHKGKRPKGSKELVDMLKAIGNAAESVADFFIISKFAPVVFVVGVMALFGSPAIIAGLLH